VALGVEGTIAFVARNDANVFGWFSAPTPPVPDTEDERKVLTVLGEMRATGKTYLSVSERTGGVLRLLTEVAGAKNVIAVGTSTGYSGLGFCLALQRAGGRLITFAIDPSRGAMARENSDKVDVGQLVTVVQGDAHEAITRL
jgi:caffeoyl-CoA O-methyltransferase